MDTLYIDVREKDEFIHEHIEHSINIPLSSFNTMAPGIMTQVKDRKIVFICQSGARATQAKSIAEKTFPNLTIDFQIFDGGLLQWKKGGNPTNSFLNISKTLPLLRQVQITIGALIILFSLLSALVNPAFIYLTLAMGIGVFVAGSTGFCALATSMAKMPWNRAQV